MQPIRSALLWASNNKWLERQARSRSTMRAAASRFLPGETLDAAIAAVGALRERGVPAILTFLGENVSSETAADACEAEYLTALKAIAARRLDAWISVKLTQLGLDGSVASMQRRLDRLAAAAADAGTQLWMDMEGSSYTSFTIDAYVRLLEKHDGVGLCLQAYLHRTPSDVERLLGDGGKARIRLVKGAYRESAQIALRTRTDIDAAYVLLAARLLAHTSTSGIPHAFGTHDIALTRRVLEQAARAHVDPGGFEIQMLYGIQERTREQLERAGVRTRVLISYGEHWYPWYMRRLAEKPSNILLAARSILDARTIGR